MGNSTASLAWRCLVLNAGRIRSHGDEQRPGDPDTPTSPASSSEGRGEGEPTPPHQQAALRAGGRGNPPHLTSKQL